MDGKNVYRVSLGILNFYLNNTNFISICQIYFYHLQFDPRYHMLIRNEFKYLGLLKIMAWIYLYPFFVSFIFSRIFLYNLYV